VLRLPLVEQIMQVTAGVHEGRNHSAAVDFIIPSQVEPWCCTLVMQRCKVACGQIIMYIRRAGPLSISIIIIGIGASQGLSGSILVPCGPISFCLTNVPRD
jgi:hypothetical protein